MRLTSLLGALSLLAMAACGGDASTTASTELFETTTTTNSATTTALPMTTTSTSVAETTTTTEDLERAAAEAAALERVLAFFEAANAGEVDEFEDILGVPLTEARRRHFEFHSILKSYGFEWEVETCEITASFGSIINIDCVMHNGNPVFEATGASDVIAPFSVVGGELRESQWEPLEAGFDAPLGVFVDYLTLFTDQYPLCDPGEVEGEFTEHLGIARVPECAEALVEHMDDMVAWVEAGQPRD